MGSEKIIIFSDPIFYFLLDNGGEAKIFSIDGKPLNEPQKGVNIIRMDNGKTMKVVVK